MRLSVTCVGPTDTNNSNAQVQTERITASNVAKKVIKLMNVQIRNIV